MRGDKAKIINHIQMHRKLNCLLTFLAPDSRSLQFLHVPWRISVLFKKPRPRILRALTAHFHVAPHRGKEWLLPTRGANLEGKE